jgi:dUTP pyrophosphatase
VKATDVDNTAEPISILRRLPEESKNTDPNSIDIRLPVEAKNTADPILKESRLPDKANLLLNLKVKRLKEDIKLPVRGTEGAIGFDLHSSEDLTIPPGSRRWIPLGISIMVLDGTYACLAPRSSQAKKHSIDIAAGVCDPDYRGELFAGLINNGTEEFKIAKNDRICQLICEQAEVPLEVEVQDTGKTIHEVGSIGKAEC